MLSAVNWTKVKQVLAQRPLIRAFGISVLLHFLTFFVIEAGHGVGLWKMRAVPKSWAAVKNTQDQAASEKEAQILQFLEIDPAQVVQEEPKDTKFYSTANTVAANPDTRLPSNVPKIEGTQEKFVKTLDVAKVDPKPSQPTPPQPKRDTMQPLVKQTAGPTEPVGDTKENTLTPEEKSQRDMTFDRPGQKPTPPRPRTLAQAREQKGISEEPKTKQDGGVSKYALESSMDTKSSPFGAYDAQFIAAVRARWYALIEQREQANTGSGKVVVEFRLYSDGRIQQLRAAESEVNDLYTSMCQRAILDPAPYAKFPADLKRLLGKDYREVRFTFHYL